MDNIKSISESKTFSDPVNDINIILEIVEEFAKCIFQKYLKINRPGKTIFI